MLVPGNGFRGTAVPLRLFPLWNNSQGTALGSPRTLGTSGACALPEASYQEAGPRERHLGKAANTPCGDTASTPKSESKAATLPSGTGREGTERASKRTPATCEAPAHTLRMDQGLVVSPSPGQGPGRLAFSSGELDYPLWARTRCYSWPSWFHSQFQDNCPHSCPLCPGHFCHDLKGTTSKPRLPTLPPSHGSCSRPLRLCLRPSTQPCSLG